MIRYLLTPGFLLFISLAFAQSSDHVPGQLIVKLKPESSPDKIVERFANVRGQNTGFKQIQVLSKSSSIYLFSFNQLISEENMLSMLGADTSVQLVQFNHLVESRSTLPNDTDINSQWHHQNVGDFDVDSDLAWDTTTGGTTLMGDEIVVCVIENGGSNYNHSDLIGNHWVNTAEIPNNSIDDDGNGFVDDYDGWNPVSLNDNVGFANHGTAVSGMIGAKGDNNLGGAGINWNVKIMQVGLGNLTESNVIAAYNYPLTMRLAYNASSGSEGAFVVATNASWGIDNADPSNFPVWCAYYDELGQAGILNCGATSNSAVNVDVSGDMPTGCSSDYMISVTATNNQDQRTFSGYGQTTIDLAAPGENVYLPSGSSAYSANSGTSFASPCVAGAIALIYSAPCTDLAEIALSNPQEAANMVRSYILNGVDPIAGLTTETVTGGRLNVKNSLDLALNACGPLPPCDPQSLSLTTNCEIEDGQVMASITLDVQTSEDFCLVEEINLTPQGGSTINIDLIAEGINLNNASPFTISGLESNTLYTLTYSTSDGISNPENITTGACSDLTAGCIDSSANNYNANANIDDGSCEYPCLDLTISITTDCWGYETSWTLQDSDGEDVVAVVEDTYGNLQTYTWENCLEYGCYTFAISDSYGDGVGGTTSGCQLNGSYSITDIDGNVLVEMEQANFGFGTAHQFCFPEDDLDCLGDLNNDGSRNAGDLLVFLADFGCSENCLADFTADNVVNGSDLLFFLSVFATPCP